MTEPTPPRAGCGFGHKMNFVGHKVKSVGHKVALRLVYIHSLSEVGGEIRKVKPLILMLTFRLDPQNW